MSNSPRRLLIISPRFPPVNAADMHRVRMTLPFFRENGWAAEVLAVSAASVEGPRDSWLADVLPEDVPVHRVNGLSLSWGRIPGLRSLAFRVFRAMERAGDELLTRQKFDLVYFSTTEFPLHLLGPRWKSRHGTPFVLDYQDPWVNDYYREHPDVVPPGGRWKYWAADRINRWAEPAVLNQCAGVTSVSEDYVGQLRRRYPEIALGNTLVASFPGSSRDFACIEAKHTTQRIFDPADGNIHWVYAGRGGPDMAKSVRAILQAVRDYAGPQVRAKLRLHFIGTSYARSGDGEPTILPLAAEYGLTGQVSECTGRIPYAETLRCLLDASALLVPGSDDSSYTASKIYPYLLARKPLLAVFHERSSVVAMMKKCGGGVCIPFQSSTTPDVLAAAVGEAWFAQAQYLQTVALAEEEFLPYTDAASARTLAQFFHSIAEQTGNPAG